MTRRCGFTLVELLVVIVIVSIALASLMIPFVAERAFWRTGDRQAEAQRDAQVVLEGMARAAREASAYTIINDGAGGNGYIQFTINGQQVEFQGGPAFSPSGTFEMRNLATAVTSQWIDGVRSRVTSFTLARPIASSDKLVRARLVVAQQGTEDEVLETEIFLHNGT